MGTKSVLGLTSSGEIPLMHTSPAVPETPGLLFTLVDVVGAGREAACWSIPPRR